jgi:hypothetical protein
LLIIFAVLDFNGLSNYFNWDLFRFWDRSYATGCNLSDLPSDLRVKMTLEPIPFINKLFEGSRLG